MLVEWEAKQDESQPRRPEVQVSVHELKCNILGTIFYSNFENNNKQVTIPEHWSVLGQWVTCHFNVTICMARTDEYTSCDINKYFFLFAKLQIKRSAMAILYCFSEWRGLVWINFMWFQQADWQAVNHLGSLYSRWREHEILKMCLTIKKQAVRSNFTHLVTILLSVSCKNLN